MFSQPFYCFDWSLNTLFICLYCCLYITQENYGVELLFGELKGFVSVIVLNCGQVTKSSKSGFLNNG